MIINLEEKTEKINITVHDVTEISDSDLDIIKEIAEENGYVGSVIVLEATIQSSDMAISRKFSPRKIFIGNDDRTSHSEPRFKVYKSKSNSEYITIILSIDNGKVVPRHEGNPMSLGMSRKELNAYYDFGIRNYTLLKYCTRRSDNLKYCEEEIKYDEAKRKEGLVVYRNLDDPFTSYQIDPLVAATPVVVRRK